MEVPADYMREGNLTEPRWHGGLFDMRNIPIDCFRNAGMLDRETIFRGFWDDITFDNMAESHTYHNLMNPDNLTIVQRCRFFGCAGGPAGDGKAIYHWSNLSPRGNLRYYDNLFAPKAQTHHVRFVHVHRTGEKGAMSRIQYSGNHFYNDGPLVSQDVTGILMEANFGVNFGVAINGMNTFEGCTRGIDILAGRAAWRGVWIMQNRFDFRHDPPTNERMIHIRRWVGGCRIIGNHFNAATYNPYGVEVTSNTGKTAVWANSFSGKNWLEGNMIFGSGSYSRIANESSYGPLAGDDAGDLGEDLPSEI